MFVPFSSVKTPALEATDSGAATTLRPGQPKLRLLSRHHSQDMLAAYSSSIVIIKFMIYMSNDKKHGEFLYV